ncbi:uncharacterized protein [Argopecten irradians]|uniref:uncharacterized protein n=1 Tax=Argopecten irradians TaxID=31199 RepID=UPI00372014EF
MSVCLPEYQKMDEQNKCTRTEHATTLQDSAICNTCGHQPLSDAQHINEDKTSHTSHRNRTSRILNVLGLVAILEGFLCFVAAYIDQTWGVLPTDPLFILGVASILAGCVLAAGSYLTYAHDHCKDGGKEYSPTCEGRVVRDQIVDSDTIFAASTDKEQGETTGTLESSQENKKDK